VTEAGLVTPDLAYDTGTACASDAFARDRLGLGP
jgi:hypothetical protein